MWLNPSTQCTLVAETTRVWQWGMPITDASSHKSYRPFTMLSFRINSMITGLVRAELEPFPPPPVHLR